ncbi:MAG: hypothetical protein HYW26_04720 [Candidatus Aenigmarchaeota archaeon]|nr:hypothetical protein [Candidatus Aenigmarchaeota archaeon]
MTEATKKEKFSGGRKLISLIVMLLLVVSVIFASGCVSQPKTTIKSEREVGEAVTNISGDVEDVSQILNDIDRKLG